MNDFKPLIAITFDDGDRSILEAAFPVMQDAGFVGTSYVTPAMAGGAYLDLREHTELSKWEIGAHGLTHNHLTPMSDADQWVEVMTPIQQLTDLLGHRPASFACPYGDCDPRLISKVKLVHHTHVCVGGPALGVNSLAMWNRYHVSRFCPIVDTPVERIAGMIDGLVYTQMLGLCFHRIDDSGDKWSWSLDAFKRLIDHIVASKCSVLPMTEAARRMDWMQSETRGYFDRGVTA